MQRFTSNAGPWCGAVAIAFGGSVICFVIYMSIRSGIERPPAAWFFTMFFLSIVMTGLTVLHAFYTRGALLEIEGNRPAIGEFFKLPNLSQVLLICVASGLAGAVGSCLCFVGLFVALPVAAMVQAHAYRQLLSPPATVGP